MKKAIYHFPSRSPTIYIYTRSTDDLSGILAVFTFDRNLFVTKVYERAYRSSIRDRIRALKFINKNSGNGEIEIFFELKRSGQQGLLSFVPMMPQAKSSPSTRSRAAATRNEVISFVNDQQDYSDESLLQHRVVNAFRNLSDTMEFSPINLSADNILIISELWSRLGRLVLRAMQNGGRGPFFALESTW